MVEIINRVKYDTDNAEEVYSYSNNLGYNDFNYVSEVLYKTSKGNFFLHGEGGARSKYADVYPGGASGDSTIIPMNDNEVIDWLESRGGAEEIEKLFPDAIETA